MIRLTPYRINKALKLDYDPAPILVGLTPYRINKALKLVSMGKFRIKV